jgi:DNA-binding beta-propeller fold protein YncE
MFLAGVPGQAVGQRPAEKDLVWPLPPESPKVRFVGQLSNEQDVGKKLGFFARLRNALSGTRGSVIGVQRPHDVQVDGGDRFFVSDGARGKLVVFKTDQRQAFIVGEEGAGYLRKPLGLGGDGRGTIYVADGSGARVVAFDREGRYLRAYGGEHQLLNPADVAVDADRDRLYVADSYLHQVVVFSISSGEVVQHIGRDDDDLAAKREALTGMWQGGMHGARAESAEAGGHPTDDGTPRRDLELNRGGGPGEFRYPAFVAVSPDGTVYVTDQMNFRVQAFDATGKFIRVIGGIGDGPGYFARPKGVGVDGEGHLYVADGAFNNVQIFNADGQLLLVFSGMGTDEGQLYLPLGLSIDGTNHVYVADRYNNRVQVYQFMAGGAPSTKPAERSRR